MKYTFLTLALLAAPYLGAQETERRGCRLDGGYAATLTGSAPGFGDVNGTGVIDADGSGKFAGNVGGVSVAGQTGTVYTTPVTGTYKIAADCSLTFTMTFVNLKTTVEGQGAISADGREVNLLVTLPSNVKITAVAGSSSG